MNLLAPLLCAFLPGLPEEMPFCGIEVPTVRQMVDDKYVAVVAKCASVEKPIPHKTVGRTKYQVVQIIHDPQNSLAGKTEVVVERYWPGEPGDLFLLYDSRTRNGEWNRPISISKSSLKYIKQVASLDGQRGKHIEFFLNYLEHSDPFVSYDAYREFDDASLQKIQAISSKLPRKKLSKWIKSGKIKHRRGLYSLLLGLCGDDKDAVLLGDFIKKPAKQYRTGIDGVMCGYLLLKREEGLKLLDDSKLKAGVDSPPAETRAAMKALFFAWQHTDIPKDRLKKSMRLLLDHPTLSQYAVLYLTHWKDWEAQDQVMAIYNKQNIPKTNNERAVQRAVIRYLLSCSKDTKENADQNPIEKHAKTAKKHLGTLRKIDPRTVKQAERYFNIK